MQTKNIPWHSLDVNEIVSKLKTDFDNGLSEKEAERRLKKFGRNVFDKKEKYYYLKLFWEQIKSPLVFILIIAGIISYFLKEYTDSLVIFIAVLINTAIGMFQEGRASRALEKLKSAQKRQCVVIREGRQKVIDSANLVPGDIIILQMGDFVPADARLIEEKGLEVNESILTGEWMAVAKNAEVKLAEKTRITEMENMVWMSTLVTEGWAKAVVVSTGFDTEVGKIAESISKEEKVDSPLQKGVKKLARFLGIVITFSIVLLFLVGIMRGEDFNTMFLIAVAVAVAAIPEGLPVAVSVVLAVGMERILSKGGLIKNMNSTETLGSTSVILTDKTGTITKGEMQVSKIMTYLSENPKYREKKHKDRLQVLEMAMLASNAFVENQEDELKEWIIRGNPVDKAILSASIELGIKVKEIFKKYPRIDFIPFDSERRYSASLHKTPSGSRVYVLGAPELILSFCNKVYKEGKEIKMDSSTKDFLSRAYEKETSQGIRVIAVAYKDGNWKKFFHHSDKNSEILKEMVFGGFIGFHDPVREDVIEAIKRTKEAMVNPVMVTGDHLITAKKIASEVGLLEKGSLIVSGEDLEEMTDAELRKKIEEIKVFARVLPHQKMKIVKIWQEKGEVVAMTGDGVNDAPALKSADIGIALGSGTDVAKEASDMILLNNSFRVITDAIEEGRRILDNLKKTIAYLLSTNFTEIIIIAVAIISGSPLPVLPIQILWINIVAEGFMNFAFAFEPKEPGIMKRSPKKQSSGKIIDKHLGRLIAILSVVTSISTLVMYFILLSLSYPIEDIRTIMFGAIIVGALFFAFSLKSLQRPIWKINIFSNRYLVFAWFISMFLFLIALFNPHLQKLLSLKTLTFSEIAIVLSVGFFNLFVIEITKYFLFEKKNNKIKR